MKYSVPHNNKFKRETFTLTNVDLFNEYVFLEFTPNISTLRISLEDSPSKILSSQLEIINADEFDDLLGSSSSSSSSDSFVIGYYLSWKNSDSITKNIFNSSEDKNLILNYVTEE